MNTVPVRSLAMAPSTTRVSFIRRTPSFTKLSGVLFPTTLIDQMKEDGLSEKVKDDTPLLFVTQMELGNNSMT